MEIARTVASILCLALSCSIAHGAKDGLAELARLCAVKVTPNPPDLRGKSLEKDLADEGPRTLKWYRAAAGAQARELVKRVGFVDRVADLQKAAKAAIKEGKTLDGWKVKEFPIQKDKRAFQDYDFAGNTAWDSHFAFGGGGLWLGTPRAYAFEKPGMSFIATVINKDGKPDGAEIYLIEDPHSKSPKPMVLGINKDFIEGQKAYGTGVKGSSEILGILGQFSPVPNVDDITAKWQNVEDKLLGIGPKLDLRGVLKQVVDLHQEQLGIKGGRKKESNFYYDDRGSMTTGTKFVANDGTTVQARKDGKLLRINEYAGVQMIVDEPRAGDKSVRLWFWDKDRKLMENYELPLSEGKAPKILSKTELFLPSLYRTLLSTRNELKEKNKKLLHPDDDDDGN